jgi:outer membrane receptor for ferrienterochelin and colicins
VEFNSKVTYTLIDFEPEIKLTFSVYNMFNSFQDDFDLGAHRDSGYIYGAVRPRTFSVGVSTAI